MIGEVYFSQWARLGFRVGVNYFSSTEKLFMHEKALFASDLLKAREIMGEDRSCELRRLGREVRRLNVGVWRRRAPNVVYKGNRAKFLQNERTRMELFESRENVLVEASRGDRFWRIGLGMGDENLTAHQCIIFRRLYQCQSNIFSTFLSKITK